MRSGYEERVRVYDGGMVHYLHRHWSDNGDTLCGIRVWFVPRKKGSEDVAGIRLFPQDKGDVTCMECILLQAPP